jgi:SAM-dependent methyltransferase
MIARCPAWAKSPAIAAEFLTLLPQFGCDATLQVWAANYARMHGGRCKWDADFLAARYDVSTCLNVGGAPFLFEFFLRRAAPGANMVTLDLEPSRFSQAQAILQTRIEPIDIEAMRVGDAAVLGKFKCVVFAEIFEHMRMNLLGTVRSLRDLLTDDGVLYITTPNGLRWSVFRDHITRGRTGPDPVREWGKLETLGHMGHVREYSRREVAAVLEHCGFSIEFFCYRRSERPARSAFSKLRTYGDRLLASIFPWLGQEVIFVAKKRAP